MGNSGITYHYRVTMPDRTQQEKHYCLMLHPVIARVNDLIQKNTKLKPSLVKGNVSVHNCNTWELATLHYLPCIIYLPQQTLPEENFLTPKETTSFPHVKMYYYL